MLAGPARRFWRDRQSGAQTRSREHKGREQSGEDLSEPCQTVVLKAVKVKECATDVKQDCAGKSGAALMACMKTHLADARGPARRFWRDRQSGAQTRSREHKGREQSGVQVALNLPGRLLQRANSGRLRPPLCACRSGRGKLDFGRHGALKRPRYASRAIRLSNRPHIHRKICTCIGNQQGGAPRGRLTLLRETSVARD